MSSTMYRLKKADERWAMSFRYPQQVTDGVYYLRARCYYPLCPRCRETLAREYVSFCDRCGQRLDWDAFDHALVQLR